MSYVDMHCMCMRRVVWVGVWDLLRVPTHVCAREM